MKPGSFTILLVTALLLSAMSVQTAGAADARSYIAKGDACAEKEDYASAFDYFSKAIDLDSKCSGAYFRIGVLYVAKAGIDLSEDNTSGITSYCELAIKEFSTAINLNPKYDKAYRFRAICYNVLNKPDLAIVDYTKAIKINPKHALLYVERGDVYTKKNKLDAALRDYETCARLDPRTELIYARIGGIYTDKGMHAKAIPAYDKALQLQPNYALPYYFKGVSYMELGKKQEALAAFQKFVSKYPNCSPQFIEKYSAYCDRAFLCIDMLKKQLAGSAG